MKYQRSRRSEFLLREQDEGGGEAPKGPYTPPRERILQLPDVSDTMTETNASLDELVDRYILQYEKEAVPVNQDPDVGGPAPITERKKKTANLYSILFEQDAPLDAGGGADAGGGMDDTGGGDLGIDSAGGDDSGNETKPGEEAPVAPVPKINIRHFAEGVARLVSNYRTLLDPETIIMNRAMYYISKNYSARLAKEMMNILQRDFNLTPKTKSQQAAEIPPAPRQGNAGPDSGGGVPSGGSSGGGD